MKRSQQPMSFFMCVFSYKSLCSIFKCSHKFHIPKAINVATIFKSLIFLSQVMKRSQQPFNFLCGYFPCKSLCSIFKCSHKFHIPKSIILATIFKSLIYLSPIMKRSQQPMSFLCVCFSYKFLCSIFKCFHKFHIP